MASEDAYEAVLDILVGKATDYIEAQPELRSLPTEDMFSSRDPYEDVDDEEEEEEYWEEDEEYEEEDE